LKAEKARLWSLVCAQEKAAQRALKHKPEPVPGFKSLYAMLQKRLAAILS
jgi:hypothetical protein